MPDEACRLAKVEQRIENLEEMKNEQTRYKGFIGGIVFTISALFSFIAWWTSK